MIIILYNLNRSLKFQKNGHILLFNVLNLIYNNILLFFYCAGDSGPDVTAAQKESAGRPSAVERSGIDHPGRGVSVEFS